MLFFRWPIQKICGPCLAGPPKNYFPVWSLRKNVDLIYVRTYISHLTIKINTILLTILYTLTVDS